MARALDRAGADLSVIVNVGDDDVILGQAVSPDLDTVMYTLAGIEGPHGWGLADDTLNVMRALADLGGDTRFTLGDRDLATNLTRTIALASGETLSAVTRRLASLHGVRPALLPVTDHVVRTEVRIEDGWIGFQEYFVYRGHRDRVLEVRHRGAVDARPAPGVIEAIDAAEAIVIAPSNPPLSVWPILSVPGMADAVSRHRTVVAISPLFTGEALKGPAHDVMRSLGLPAGNAGVIAAYEGLITDLIVDHVDSADRAALSGPDLRVHVADTHIADPDAAEGFGRWLLALLSA